MLSLEKAIEVMYKYGFSSTSEYPFIYQDDQNIGVCYNYIDENYGYLERVKFFDDEVVLEEFLKKLQWIYTNGKLTNSRMVLDNYQTKNPKNIFLRNEKIMVKGEMFDIEEFERKESLKSKMDPVSRTLEEVGALLQVYDELKVRQLDYYKRVRVLNNDLRNKYFLLQQGVDKYNKHDVEREVKLLPDIVSNDGVNTMMETSIKDRYNQFKVKPPQLDEALGILKEAWDLNFGLESNRDYYEAIVLENNCLNEIKVVDEEIAYINKLNDNKDMFTVDLKKKFELIKRHIEPSFITLSNDFIDSKIKSIEKKYSFFDYLNKNKLASYLKETVIDTNYSDVALKYGSNNNVPDSYFVKKPLNEIVSDLFVQYRDSLSLDEQTILVLYNSKYRNLFDLIFEVDNFDSIEIKQLVSILSKKSGFSKIKSECYDYVKNVINDECNKDVKTKLFSKISFDSFEAFLSSALGMLRQFKNINNKIKLNSDINMYFFLNDKNMSNVTKFIPLTCDLNAIKGIVTNSNNLIAITCLKTGLPVLYSPYYLDFGNVYDKKSRQLAIREKTKFELFIDKDDVKMYMDENTNLVVDYQASKQLEGDVTIVHDIILVRKVNYCRMALFNNVLEGSK